MAEIRRDDENRHTLSPPRLHAKLENMEPMAGSSKLQRLLVAAKILRTLRGFSRNPIIHEEDRSDAILDKLSPVTGGT